MLEQVEGGRNPLKRFGESLANCTDEEVERFYSLNMVDLMGASMPVSLPAEEFPSCRTP